MSTNLTILAISAGQALTGAFFVVYGNPRSLSGIPAPTDWRWTVFVMLLGIGGVLMFIAKGIIRPRWLRLALGLVGVVPMLFGIVNAYVYGVSSGFLYLLLAAAAVVYSLSIDEPEPGEKQRFLLMFLASALLVLQPFAFLLLGEGATAVVPLPLMFAMSALGAFAAWAHARRTGSVYDLTGRFSLAAAFAVLSAGAYMLKMPLLMVSFAPIAVILASHGLLRRYRLGLPDKPGSLTDEGAAVRQFEALAEMLAWSTFAFAFIHMLFVPSVIAVRSVLFVLFAGAFAIFSIQYRLFRPERMNFRHMYRSSIVNAVLLSIICHFTGGISSPYNWFFIFILMSGSIAPHPRRILHRLGVILAYYLIETLYFIVNGFFTRDLIVNHLMIEVFVLGLTGMYAYHLSVRRRKIDADLMEVNERVRKALERETAAKTLIARQAVDIALAKQRDEAILASLADAVVVFDAGGLIDSLNPSAEGLLRLAVRDARGKRLRDLMPIRQEDEPDFRLGQYMDAAKNGNAVPLPENVYLEREDGRRLYLKGVILPILDDARRVTGIVMTMSDITHIREVDLMKTGFLSVAAHQLRTPLSTIRWYLELLNDPSEGKLKKNQKMFAENAYLSLRKMVGLVNRLLAVTRLESGRVPFRPEPTDIASMTRDVLESLRHKLEEGRYEVKTDLPDLPSVPLDRTLAREVLINLLENAIRYTPSGGRIAIDAKDEGDAIAWSVTDTGIGIPKAQQERIFGKFFRASNAVEHSSEGSGLGLYLAKFIVDAWGGTISFSSEEGKGTAFRVTIPKAGMRAKEGQVSLNA